jgi:hypothetical protein
LLIGTQRVIALETQVVEQAEYGATPFTAEAALLGVDDRSTRQAKRAVLAA